MHLAFIDSQRIVQVFKGRLTILFDIFHTVFVGRKKSRKREREQNILKADKKLRRLVKIII